MSDRPEERGFSVAPQPLGGPAGGGGARRRRLAVGMVASAAAAILAISWLGPRQAGPAHPDGVSFATPTPTPGLPPVSPFATPLPALTGGAARFSGTVGVMADGVLILDLATGETTGPIPLSPGQAVVTPAPDGAGWRCICMVGGSVKDVQLVRLDQLGRELDRRTIGRLGTIGGPDRSIAVQTALDLAADGQTGIVAVAVQGPSEWTYSTASLDLAAGTLGPLTPLGTQRPERPSASPDPSTAPGPSGASMPPGEPTAAPSQTIILGPQVRLAPGGDRAFVWATLHVGDFDVGESESVAWTIRLDRQGNPTAVDPVPDLAGRSICFVGGFLGPDQFVAICESPGPAAPEWSIREIAADGHLIWRVALPDLADFGTDMLFDTANGSIWAWNGSAMRLSRIDGTTGTVTDKTFDRGAVTMSGGEPLGGKPPVWVRPDAPVPNPFGGQMSGSRDGTRLYVLGYSNDSGSSGASRSVGILVVDPRTMALLGRWAGDAAYSSIRVGLGGSVVMASGIPGVDDRGDRSLWEASITFHDAVDGRILARYGRLGDFPAPMIIEP